jgi:hypothetical protein
MEGFFYFAKNPPCLRRIFRPNIDGSSTLFRMSDSPSDISPIRQAIAFARRYLGWLVITVAVGVGANSLSKFHHPVFGFTRLLQISPSWGLKGLPELREDSIYIYRDEAGYDGQFYAQLALRPTLQDPALSEAIDIPSMRARRILTSWTAALIGLDDGVRTLHAYAWLNVICWIGLGVVLLRLFPPHGLANLIAWIGVMFSAGVTTSVVYALTDLPALLLLAIGMLVLQRGHLKSTAGLFAAACLTRETSVLGGLIVFQAHTWQQRIINEAIIVVPLALWFFYVSRIFPSNPNSLQNFALPLTALGSKLHEIFSVVMATPHDRLGWAAVGAIVGVIVQAGWLLVCPQPRNPWWQLGIGYVLLLLILGAPIFEGFPSAVTRLMLPLHLAFNVLAPRTRAGLVLLLLGNLSIFVGGYMLSQGPRDTFELNHFDRPDGPVIVHIEEGWSGVERNELHTWSWSGGEGRLRVHRFTDSEQPAPVGLIFTLVGELGCDITIHQGDKLLWSGFSQKPGVTVSLRNIKLDETGRAWLDFHSDDPPFVEPGTGRRLAFAVFNFGFLAE